MREAGEVGVRPAARRPLWPARSEQGEGAVVKWEKKGESCWDGNHKKFSTEVMQSNQSFKKFFLAVVWRMDPWIGSYSHPGERFGWPGPEFGTKFHRFVCFLSYRLDGNNFISIFYGCYIPLSLAFMFQRKRIWPVWLFLLFCITFLSVWKIVRLSCLSLNQDF